MIRVNRPAGRFTLRSRCAGSKGNVAWSDSLVLRRHPACPEILGEGSAAKDRSFFSLALTLKKTKTVCACAA